MAYKGNKESDLLWWSFFYLYLVQLLTKPAMKKFTLFIFLYGSILYGQESLSNKEALVWFDAFFGQENLAICVGEKHSENYRTLKGQYPYLFNNNYYTSEVKYNDQVYYNVQVKYNIADDELVVLINTAIDRNPIVLSKNKVSHFYIDNKKFVNLNADLGYAQELLTSESQALYKKYIKRKLEKTISSGAVVEFLERENYLLNRENDYITISSKKDWIRQFPNQKSKIKDFYSSNRKLLKSNPDTFMSNLFNSLMQK